MALLLHGTALYPAGAAAYTPFRGTSDWLRDDDPTAPGKIRTCDLRFRKPRPENPKGLTDTALTDTHRTDLASGLAQIIREHPELSKLVQVWPTLPQGARAAILQMIER
jgi:hypothetical protein